MNQETLIEYVLRWLENHPDHGQPLPTEEESDIERDRR